MMGVEITDSNVLFLFLKIIKKWRDKRKRTGAGGE
jgi:hypothetical protein